MAIKYEDPVEAFKKACKQEGTVAQKWNTEVELQRRLNRQPLVALIWSYKYPGAGMFYLGRPFAGVVMILIYVLYLIVLGSLIYKLCIAENTFEDKAIACLVTFFILSFLYYVITCIYTFCVALKDHKKAVQDWEEYKTKQEKAKQENNA